MNSNARNAVLRLSRDAAKSGIDIAGEAARATGGLPVQCDMGGVLVLMPGGEVLHYDPETRSSAAVRDSRWRIAAFAKAARTHAELASLFPARPTDAITCTQCGGSGKVFEVADCGLCMGTGWLTGEGQ